MSRVFLRASCSLISLLACVPVAGYAASTAPPIYDNMITPQLDDQLQPRAEVGVKGGSERSTLTTEFWAPVAQKSGQVLYTDLRLMGDDDDNREGNLGFGYRQIVNGPDSIFSDQIVGGHLWIDQRRTDNNSTFHQVTFGVESLGNVIDLRANGYVPLSKSNTITTPNIGSTTPYLAGSGIFVDGDGSIKETPQYGADAEIGYRVPVFEKRLDTIRIYGGGYTFFRNNTDSVTGYRVRTEAVVNPAISVGARFQHDGPRGSQGFLEATLRFPFTAKKMYQQKGLYGRLDESPERDIDIVTSTKVDTGLRKPIINTVTDTPQRILYVDNSLANGDGTKEHPFNNLTDAQNNLKANDILYIAHGDGTTAHMDQGITITQSNVTLIGSGSALTIGGITFIGAGLAPTITNTQAFVDDGGGTINSNTGNGIFVTGGNIAISGIIVDNAKATGIYIRDNQPGSGFGSVTISNVTSMNNQNGRGIQVYASNGAVIDTVSVTNSAASDNPGASGAGRGIEVRAQGAGSTIHTVDLGNDVAGGNASYGFEALSNIGGRIDSVNIDHGNTSGNGSTGVEITSVANSQIGEMTVTNTIASNNTGQGIIANMSTNGQIGSVTMSGDTTSQNTAQGLYVFASAGSVGSVMIDNNTSTSNTAEGLFIFIPSGHVGDVKIDDNTFSGNGNIGLYVNASTGGTIDNAEMSGNTVSSNAVGGIQASASSVGSRIGSVTINNNNVSGNTGVVGIELASSASGEIVSATVTGNTANNNLDGIEFTTGASIDAATVSGNTIDNNTIYGLYIFAQSAASILNNISVSANDITGNTTDGVYLQKAVAAATMNVDLGGGAQSSIGQNRVSGNTGKDIQMNYVGGGSVVARNNWWGIGTGLNQATRAQLSASTTLDSSAFLTTDPRP